MDQINPRAADNSLSYPEALAATFMNEAIKAWIEELGVHNVELAPPFTKLNVELTINGIEMSFTEASTRVYARMESSIRERAMQIAEQKWSEWLEGLGERGERLEQSLRETGKNLGELRIQVLRSRKQDDEN